MKKACLLLTAILSIGATLFAQDDQGSTLEQPSRPALETPWAKESIGAFSVPVPYPPVIETDIAYYVTIWRTIDLREKMNHPLYFPTETKGTWRSLAQVIYDAVDFENPENTEVLTIYSDEFVNAPLPREEVVAAIQDVQYIDEIDPITGEVTGETKELPISYPARDIYSYRLKEVWFFDKQRSVLDVRILEIEPMLEVERNNAGQATDGEGDDFVEMVRIPKRIGFIRYDELRPYLVRQEMFNVKNNAQRLSLDDVLTFKRQFFSFIYAEDNVYGRWINEYIENPRDQRLESERITNEIRVFEHDLWEF